MKTLKFKSQDSTIDVEYLVDIIGDNDMFTVYQITQYVGGVKQVNLNGIAQTFGMPDHYDQTVNVDNTRTKYTLVEFIAMAGAKNLTMTVHESGQSVLTKHTLTDLGITTAAIDAGVAGVAQIETLTIPVVAEAQIETLTIPSTAGAAQGDYTIITNVAGVKFAVWLDIDANGTPPSGAAYVASDEKIEVNIIGGGTAIANAALAVAAIELNANWAGITLLDNADGTITVTQDVVGDVADTAVHNTGDTGAGNILAAVVNNGLDGAVQGDYIVLTNALSQEKAAVWLNIDADDTVPTGVKYTGADFQVEVAISTGDSAIANATAVYNALVLETGWADEVTLADVGDGTITVTQDYNGVAAEADPENSGSTGVGSITSSTGTTGTVGTAYDFDFTADGGSPSLIWTTASTLPEGVVLTTAGNLVGTPREVGTFPLTIVVTDVLGVEDTLIAENFVVSAA